MNRFQSGTHRDYHPSTLSVPTPDKSGNLRSQFKWTVTAFYKGESQGKNFPGDWKEQRFLPGSPAHVMLGGSWGALFPQIHVAVVTTASVSDATSSTVAIKMPTMVLSEARGL
jgi:hypothetical protein